MNGVINTYLNVRVGSPSVNAPSYQYLAPGSELVIDGKEYPGDEYEGINIWYRDRADNYYWSGGVDLNKSTASDSTDMPIWFEKLEISDIWNNFKEKGSEANILILDSGINDHLKPFIGAIHGQIRNFTEDSNTTKSVDKHKHGTHCAGLVAARNDSHIVGVAPEAKLLIAKISESGSLKDAGSINEALAEYLKPEYDESIDIISISQTLPLPDSQLHQQLKDHINKGRVIVAAIGNDNFKNNLNTKKYPGFYDEVISVGACEDDDTLSNYTCFPATVDIYCYGTDIMSFKDQEFPAPLTGTSQSTAIVAGICALIISALKKRAIDYDCDEIKKALINMSSTLKGNNQFKLVNPKKIFQHLDKKKS